MCTSFEIALLCLQNVVYKLSTLCQLLIILSNYLYTLQSLVRHKRQNSRLTVFGENFALHLTSHFTSFAHVFSLDLFCLCCVVFLFWFEQQCPTAQIGHQSCQCNQKTSQFFIAGTQVCKGGHRHLRCECAKLFLL